MSTCAGTVLTLPLGLDMKKLKYARFELGVFVITRLVRTAVHVWKVKFRDSVRKAGEAYLIEREKTLEPLGMNKEDEM